MASHKSFVLIALLISLSLISAASAWSVSAYLGAICTGAELGHQEDAQNNPGLSNPEVTINAQCILFEEDFPQDCDVYLCNDDQCNDQGVTVAGPRNRGDREENQGFTAFQVGCQ